MKKLILISTLILSLLSFNLAFAQDAPPSIPDFDFPETSEENNNEEAPPELEVDDEDDDTSDSSSSSNSGNRGETINDINDDLANESSNSSSSTTSSDSNSTIHAAADDVDSETTELPETGPELYLLLLVAAVYWTLPMISRKVFNRN